jgi:thioesterase domain-containing protein
MQLLVTDPPWVREILRTMQANVLALLRHRPQRAACPALLYEAVGSRPPVPLAETWRPFVTAIETTRIPGDHLSCMTPPNVNDLARDLIARIRQATERQ